MSDFVLLLPLTVSLFINRIPELDWIFHIKDFRNRRGPLLVYRPPCSTVAIEAGGYELPQATPNRASIATRQARRTASPGISAYTLTGTQQIEGARIVVVGDPGSGHSSDPYRQFNTSAFTTPKPGSLGLESGRNFHYRSPINNWDISLAKRFKFKERISLEIRMDAFDAFNHTQFDTVNSTLVVRSLTYLMPTNLPFDSNGNLVNKNGFGTISAVRPPQNLQSSAHFRFLYANSQSWTDSGK